MTITKLAWRDLVPDTDSYQELFAQPDLAKEHEYILSDTQPRLHYALEQVLSPWATSPFMLLKAPDEAEYLSLLADAMRQLQPETGTVFGGEYNINGHTVTFEPATVPDGRFAVTGNIVPAGWTEAEQLFGCLRQFNGELTLHPGMVHQANGGVLLISLRTLLAQPLLWMRLKNSVSQQRFDWVAYDESRPLPVAVPSMPLSLKVVLIGDREALADFQEMEPELADQVVYSEFEDSTQIADAEDMLQWLQWVHAVCERAQLPTLAADAWPVLIREAVRYTGDQETLPLCPLWLGKQLREAAAMTDDGTITGEQLSQMLLQREWREGYLADRMQDEILLEQILVETEGERVGQINALSVIEFPGHPRAFGEPSRISCVVHIGDGEFIDVERKASSAGIFMPRA